MLYIAATPIGNLKDITLRALEVLKSADLIIVESFSDSKKLLNAYEIECKNIQVYNDSNKGKATFKIIEALKNTELVAVYITSAGTPAVSDPGADLVKECLGNNIEISPLPGASAFGTLLSISGVRSKNILFVGFLPKRPGKIKKVFENLDKDTSVLFYESKYRLLKALDILKEVAPQASIVIGREMTKKFEQYLYFTVTEAYEFFLEHPDMLKGEFAVLIY